MPRNAYTREQNDRLRQQIERQEKSLTTLDRELREPSDAPTTEPVIEAAKEQRRKRLEDNRKHKPQPASKNPDHR